VITRVVSQQRFYNNLRAVIPAKAGIQIASGPEGPLAEGENSGFPRIKYGAGSIKSGMTRCVKSFLRQYIREVSLIL
jgi:hypothetical protein